MAIEVEYPEDSGQRPKIKNANAIIIESYSSEQLKKGIDKMVDVHAVNATDGWKAYETAVGERWHQYLPTASGKNFELLHWHIFNLKNWIRGIHHHVSLKHLDYYLRVSIQIQ
ncbi:transposase [Sanyastnella coralliicola]|uniref:transposase n=1 Tax=Sanyastnella coralliicola TaxID=3069118 RepID=UPI0027BB0D45|nr:transposase [Longitalea sp. SCSIO 12813]